MRTAAAQGEETSCLRTVQQTDPAGMRMERIIKAHFIRSAVTGRIYPKLAHLAEEEKNG